MYSSILFPRSKHFSAYYAHSTTGPDKIISSGKGLSRETGRTSLSLGMLRLCLSFGVARVLNKLPQAGEGNQG